MTLYSQPSLEINNTYSITLVENYKYQGLFVVHLVIALFKPVKGSDLVIMNKYEYKNKNLSILSDENKFMPDVEFEDISKLEESINTNLIKLLHECY